MRQFRQWWGRLPITDPVRQQQAKFFQVILVGWLILIVLGISIGLIVNPNIGASTSSNSSPLGSLTVLFSFSIVTLWLSPLLGIVLLRRGYFIAAVLISVFGLLIGHSNAVLSIGIASSISLIVYQIPIAIAGLLGGRRILWPISGAVIMFAIVVGTFGSAGDTAGVRASTVSVGITVGFFVVVTLLLTLILDQFGEALRRALTVSLAREAELQAIGDSLEATVAARTATLEQRNAEQQRLLDLITTLETPTITVADGVLLAPIVGALDSRRAQAFTARLLQDVSHQRARQVILDIAGVTAVDTQVAQALLQSTQALRLLGCAVTITGISATVAAALTQLGIALEGVTTARSPQEVLVRGARGPLEFAG